MKSQTQKRQTECEFVTETSSYYCRARSYDPSAGRFLREDPLGVNAGRVNFYSYVGNNPISRIDPFGLDWQIGITGSFSVFGITAGLGGGATVGVSMAKVESRFLRTSKLTS
jgi:RHS repeat-associated protein